MPPSMHANTTFWKVIVYPIKQAVVTKSQRPARLSDAQFVLIVHTLCTLPQFACRDSLSAEIEITTLETDCFLAVIAMLHLFAVSDMNIPHCGV